MSSAGGLIARPYRADRVAAAGAGLALVAAVLLPFASFSANRVSAPSSPNRHSSTRPATSENRAKFVPTPSKVAPSG